MSEIVVADPINDDTNEASSSRGAYTTTDSRPFIRSLTLGRDHVTEPFDSEKLPVTLISEIQRFLRIANLIEFDEPRIAYLCRFHTFEVAHNLDRNSSGRGVRQFKTSLLQRLEQDEEVTIRKRKEKSDLRELRRVYRQYKDYIIKHGSVEYTLETRPLLMKMQDLNSTCLIGYEVWSQMFQRQQRRTIDFKGSMCGEGGCKTGMRRDERGGKTMHGEWRDVRSGSGMAVPCMAVTVFAWQLGKEW